MNSLDKPLGFYSSSGKGFFHKFIVFKGLDIPLIKGKDAKLKVSMSSDGSKII